MHTVFQVRVLAGMEAGGLGPRRVVAPGLHARARAGAPAPVHPGVSPRTGLPKAETAEGEVITWYAHARSYAEAEWGSLVKASRCLAVSP